jgi:toxin ParE1/3/4
VTGLRIRPEADRDVDHAADHYASAGGIALALRFLDAVERTQMRLVEHPHIGAPVSSFDPRLSALRYCPVPGFESHLVFYVHEDGTIDIVRVLHGARDLGGILGRGSSQPDDIGELE